MAKVDLARELCKRFPKAQSKTLARRLHNDHPASFPTIETARSCIRDARGNRGKRARGCVSDKSAFRRPGKSGELPPIPESSSEPWEPFVLEARRTLAISDLHIPYHHKGAIEAALKHGDEFKPDAVLINGDLFDFYQLSRFDKNPTLPKVSAELLAGGQFLDHLRQRFPKAQIVYKLGNHDERWAKYIFQAAPLLSDIPEVVNGWEHPAGIVRNRVTVVADQRPVMLGKLPVFHGHELGRGISSPVNPARGAFLRAHHTILVGHSHQTSGHADTNIWHEETFCWSTGCLCGLTPEYARVNRWNLGFATVTVEKDGSFDVANLRIGTNLKVRKS
jgi:predicted phosphodiesterase